MIEHCWQLTTGDWGSCPLLRVGARVVLRIRVWIVAGNVTLLQMPIHICSVRGNRFASFSDFSLMMLNTKWPMRAEQQKGAGIRALETAAVG